MNHLVYKMSENNEVPTEEDQDTVKKKFFSSEFWL